MQLNEFFAAVGGNYDLVLFRLPGENMIRRFLRRFTEDPSYGNLKTALAEQNISDAFRAAHTLKGIAANLGLDALANAASDLTEALRGASAMPPQRLMDAVDINYQNVIQQINQMDA